MNYQLLFLIILLTRCISINADPLPIPDVFASDCVAQYTNRLSDYPFPTDVTFIDFCDHKVTCICDSFDPDIVELGDTVFVMDWALRWFIEKAHPL